MCIYCHYRFSNRTKLRVHYLQEHPAELPYDCTACGKRYKNANGVARHVCKHRVATYIAREPICRPETLSHNTLLKSMFVSDAPLTCDANTQTGEETTIINVGSTTCYSWRPETVTIIRSLPLCKICHSRPSMFGPVGHRHHIHFGRYFTQCEKCHGRRPGKHAAIKSLSSE
jgi:hypothetical protein